MCITEEKIALIAAGNTSAFKELYELLFPSLAAFSYKLVQNKEEASDIVQEALIAYWNKRTEFQHLDNIKAFLYAIIKNAGLNYLRSKNVHARYIQRNKDHSDTLIKNLLIEEETVSIIHSALEYLPPKTKEIVLLSLEGNKNAEIAEQLRISVNTVKTLKRRAYQKLRVHLKKHLFVLMLLYLLLF